MKRSNSKKIIAFFALVSVIAFYACSDSKGKKETSEVISGEEMAILTDAPNVPPPITRTNPTKVIVELTCIEKVGKMTDGVEYTYWTFGGKVPGKFIRVREGDEVEFRLSNAPDSKMPHNIDLHAVTGEGGGAASSFTTPGKTSIFSFKVLNPGLFVYHCATAPVGMHIANGMYGMILVEPKEGMAKVDKEYYVMQGEFYTKGRFGEEGLQAFSMEKALDERPDYVLFNGTVGALTGDKSLTANVGETVRLFVGNGGPNLVSSFHVIGEIFDRVHVEGGTTINENVQTTLVPAGGAAIAEFKVDVPGTLIMVDHSIFRAFNKGALGMIKVSGEENKSIYSGREEDKEKVYRPEGSAIQEIEEEAGPAATVANLTVPEMMEKGARIYAANCAACHQPEGKGIVGAFPPLAKSDYLVKNKLNGINAIKKGLSGPIVVNGKTYDGVMPAIQMSDADIASVLTFVRNSWGNKAEPIHISDLKAAQ